MVFSIAGCRLLAWSVDDCRDEAARQIEELKPVVSGLFPDSIAETLQGVDGCDSGDEGGWLEFTASPSASGDEIFEKFPSKGWKRIGNLRHPDNCPQCIDGFMILRNGRTIEVAAAELPSRSRLQITVEFADKPR